MSPLTAPPVSPGGAAQALFREARRRRRRRWLAGIAVVLVASAAAAVSTVSWLHRASGHEDGGTGPAGTGLGARSSAAAAVWFDGTRLHAGYIHLGGRVTQRAGAEVSADLLPLVQAGGRVYWVNPAGAFVPALGHWSQVVQYLDLATGKIGTAGPGQTVFLSADGRYLLMSQTATSLTETPVAGGASRQLTLPRGWYLPGGDGLPDVGSGEGLATANGIIVQSAESSAWRARALGLWNPRSGKVEVIGRELAVIGAYTPPGGRYSLLAWLPAACPFPDNCLLKITNTATLTARTVRSPLPGGFAAGGAFSPGGTRLAVFLNNSPSRAARLALADPVTGAVRVARGPRLALGKDFAWAPVAARRHASHRGRGDRRQLPGGFRDAVGPAAVLHARPRQRHRQQPGHQLHRGHHPAAPVITPAVPRAQPWTGTPLLDGISQTGPVLKQLILPRPRAPATARFDHQAALML